MNKSELELIIKRLDKDLGMDRDLIKYWFNTPCFNFSNCSPIDYLNVGLFHIIINKIDTMIENKGLYK